MTDLDFLAIGASLAMDQQGFTDDEIISIFGYVPHAGVTPEMLDAAEDELLTLELPLGDIRHRSGPRWPK